MGRRKSAWVNGISEGNCVASLREGSSFWDAGRDVGEEQRSSGMWGWQQQMNKCVTGCVSQVLGSAAPQICTKHVWKKRKISFIVGDLTHRIGRRKRSLRGWVVSSLPQGCVYDLSVNPSPVEPVSEWQKDQEKGFAPFPNTDSGAFHLNAGKHLYPVTTSKEKAFTDVSHTKGICKQQSARALGLCKHGAWVLQSRERSGSGCNKSMLEILCPGCLLITVSSCKLNNPQDNRSHPCHITEEEVKTHLTHELWEPTEQISHGAGHAEMGIQAKSRSLCQLSHGTLCNYLNCLPRFSVQWQHNLLCPNAGVS